MEKGIEQHALRLLARREYSRAELRFKLCTAKADPNRVDRVLERLTEAGLLSDARFTERYIESRSQRGYGPARIRAELREKGVGTALIDSALEALSEQWWERLRAVHDKRYGSDRPRDARELARRARFLLQRGFDGDHVRRFLSG